MVMLNQNLLGACPFGFRRSWHPVVRQLRKQEREIKKKNSQKTYPTPAHGASVPRGSRGRAIVARERDFALEY